MADPSVPTVVGELATPGVVRGLTITRNLLLVADDEAGLRVVDVSIPASPAEVGFLVTPGSAFGVAVSGNLALVADHLGAVVTFEGPETRSVVTGGDGGFAVTLEPGTYIVRAEHSYHLSAETTIEVRGGEALVLEGVLPCCDVDQDGDIDVRDLSQVDVYSNRPGGVWR